MSARPHSLSGELIIVLIQQGFISLALLIATLLVAGFFAYIYTLKRQSSRIIGLGLEQKRFDKPGRAQRGRHANRKSHRRQ